MELSASSFILPGPDHHHTYLLTAICYFKNFGCYMKANDPCLVPVLAYYIRLLTRYARSLVRNERAAQALAEAALIKQYDIDALRPSRFLRAQLKTELRALCCSWQLGLDSADFKGREIREEDL